MGVFNPFKSRRDFPCPVRLTLNVYVGCAFGCRYCYGQTYIRDFSIPRAKSRFPELLERDIELLKEAGLRPWISISNSTEPLQPLEEREGHTLYALRRLLEEGFPVLLVTKNPEKLCEPSYLEALSRGEARIHVTIPFLRQNPLEPHAPPPKERIRGVERLSALGFDVGVRIDPVLPQVEGLGQNPEELRELVFLLREAGARRIYAKCLRLMGRLKALQPDLYSALKPFYRDHGIWRGSYYILRDEAKEELLFPIWEAAREAGLRLFTCTDRVNLPGALRCEFESRKESKV